MGRRAERGDDVLPRDPISGTMVAMRRGRLLFGALVACVLVGVYACTGDDPILTGAPDADGALEGGGGS